MAAEPSTSKGRRTRKLVIASAMRVFADIGYGPTRMVDIAEAANLSLGGLYRYFANKDELFRAVAAQLAEDLLASLDLEHQLGLPPSEAAEKVIAAYLAFHSDNRALLAAAHEAVSTVQEIGDFWWGHRAGIIGVVADSVRSLRGSVGPDGTDLDLVLDAIVAMIERCAEVWYGRDLQGSVGPDPEAAARTLARIVLLALFDESLSDGPRVDLRLLRAARVANRP